MWAYPPKCNLKGCFAHPQAFCPSPGAEPQLPLSHLACTVMNMNTPAQGPFQGFYLAHQGSGIVDLNFQQVTRDTPGQKEGHMMDTIGNQQEAKTPKDANQTGGVRTFRNFAGAVRWCVLGWLKAACCVSHVQPVDHLSAH